MAKFMVTLFGTLPCSASREIEAEDAEKAEQIGYETYQKFRWTGSDCGDIPDGADVTEAHVEPITQS